MSLSSDEIQGRSGGGYRARLSTIPARPRSQGDSDYVSAPARRERHAKKRRHMEGSAARSMATSHLGQATWRGRLDGEQQRRGHEKGPSLSSGKKFEDLENYLRGRAAEAAAVAKRGKGKGGKVRGRDGQGLGGESSVGTVRGGGVDGEGSSRYTEEGEVRR